MLISGKSIAVAAFLYALFGQKKASAQVQQAEEADVHFSGGEARSRLEAIATEAAGPNVARLLVEIAATEGGLNSTATNPLGVELSKASVERQMNSQSYGKPGGYTKYAEPDKVKELPSDWLGMIGGTKGQGGFRRGVAILAPLAVDEWKVADGIAAAIEVIESLRKNYGATGVMDARVGWRVPADANDRESDDYKAVAAKHPSLADNAPLEKLKTASPAETVALARKYWK